MRFSTVVLLGGRTATGLVVPDDVVDALGAGRRPAVLVTVGGHSYPTTVAARGGQFLVPLSAEHRAAAGVAAGDDVEVEIVVDTASRRVEPPADLAEALSGDGSFFETLAPTHRKEWVRWVEEAKKPETRAARVTRTVEALREGRRTR